MKRVLLALVVSALFVSTGWSQEVGDSAKAVRAKLGAPSITRNSGDRQIWVYPNGTKIVLRHDVVVEAKIGAAPVAPPPPAVEEPVEPVKAAPPAPVVATPPPAANPPDHPAGWRPSRGGKSGLALGLILAGYLVLLVCSILVLIKAFKTSLLWGFGSFFIPLVQLIFVITHWSETKKPFLIGWLVGVPLLVAGTVV